MWHPVWPRGAGPREAFALRRLTRVSRGFDAAEAGLRLPAAFPLPPGASQGAVYPSRLCPARPWKLPDFGELVLSATGPGVWPRPFGERLQRRRARPAVHGPVPSAGAPTARLGAGGAGGAHWVPTERVLTCQQRTEKSTRHASAPTAHSYRTAEEVAEARKARRAAAAVRTGWAAAGGLPRGSSGGAPLGKEAGPLPPRSPAGQKQERSEMLCPSGARTSGAPGAAVGRPPARPRGPLGQLRRVARG